MSVSNSVTNTQGLLKPLILLLSKSLGANDKHDLCIQDPLTGKREFSVIMHDVNEIDKWIKGLHKRFGSPIAVAVELTKGPIVYALQRHEFVVIVPINPTTLAKYRTAFKPSKAKDDPTDAELALELMLR